VAAATPIYGRVFQGSWVVPNEIPDGEYDLLVEISKEFDTNAAHAYVAHTDPMLSTSGAKNNMGQPSVLFRVRFPLSRTATAGFHGVVSEIGGYGDWNGATGTIHAPDSTISDGPGTGQGRLLAISWMGPQGEKMGRLHVITEVPPPGEVPDAGAGPRDAAVATDGAMMPVPEPDPGADARAGGCGPLPAAVSGLRAEPEAEAATVRFIEPADAVFALVEGYAVRVWEGAEKSEAAYLSGLPVEMVAPGGPAGLASVRVGDLKSQRQYTVGVRPQGVCVEAGTAYATFTTLERKFSQLSGCFIATAAFGSPQAAAVQALRRVRDRARAASGFAAAAAALYERSSPPLAGLLRGTETGRAVVRAALGPVVGAVEVVADR
jgi:hypothetical protein